MVVRSVVLVVALLRAEASDAPLASPPADVVRPVGRDAVVNWTQLRLEVETSATSTSSAQSMESLEQAAIDRLGGALGAALGLVPLAPDARVQTLEGFEAERAVSGWTITETRYGPGERVTVVGAAALRPALGAWSVSRAVVPPVKPPEGPTGVVVDARGLEVTPTWSPRIVDPAGEVLYDGVLLRSVAYDRVPATWVTSVVAPAASTAGLRPAVLLAGAVREGAIVLVAEDAARWRAEVASTAAAANGTLVVIVDR
jgi:hypothetical protein